MDRMSGLRNGLGMKDEQDLSQSLSAVAAKPRELMPPKLERLSNLQHEKTFPANKRIRLTSDTESIATPVRLVEESATDGQQQQSDGHSNASGNHGGPSVGSLNVCTISGSAGPNKRKMHTPRRIERSATDGQQQQSDGQSVSRLNVKLGIVDMREEPLDRHVATSIKVEHVDGMSEFVNGENREGRLCENQQTEFVTKDQQQAAETQLSTLEAPPQKLWVKNEGGNLTPIVAETAVTQYYLEFDVNSKSVTGGETFVNLTLILGDNEFQFAYDYYSKSPGVTIKAFIVLKDPKIQALIDKPSIDTYMVKPDGKGFCPLYCYSSNSPDVMHGYVNRASRVREKCVHEFTVEAALIAKTQNEKSIVSGFWHIFNSRTYVIYNKSGLDIRKIDIGQSDLKFTLNVKNTLLLVPTNNQYIKSSTRLDLANEDAKSGNDIICNLDYFDYSDISDATTSSSDDSNGIYSVSIEFDKMCEKRKSAATFMFKARFKNKTRTFIATTTVDKNGVSFSAIIKPDYCTNTRFAATYTPDVPCYIFKTSGISRMQTMNLLCLS
eukprot:GHVS01025510.1.p1 GENE.GHVS01025510.1~~GHVS01025510.1.p1  ORF type:complete len:552 (-),score=38.13 GHVS01025510.1:92-1747(-)